MKYKNNKQKGFSILAVILVIVAVIVAIGIWSLSGQTNSSLASNNSTDIQASTIINDANSIKSSFDNITITEQKNLYTQIGSTISANIVFLPNTSSVPGALNVYDPVKGIAPITPNKKSLRENAVDPEGIWTHFQARFIGVGSLSGLDNSVGLVGIKDSVCKRINYNLHGSELIPTVPSGINIGADFLAGSSLANPNSSKFLNLTTLTPITGWNSGCIGVPGKPDNNMFYLVLSPS